MGLMCVTIDKSNNCMLFIESIFVKYENGSPWFDLAKIQSLHLEYNLIMVSHPEWVGPVFVRIETDTPLGLRFQGANVHFFQMSES